MLENDYKTSLCIFSALIKTISNCGAGAVQNGIEDDVEKGFEEDDSSMRMSSRPLGQLVPTVRLEPAGTDESGDSSPGFSKMMVCIYQIMMIMMMMMMMMMMVSMHAISCSRTKVATISVDSLSDDRSEKASVEGRPKMTKLKLKKGITMDSGAGNNVMPRRMVVKKSEIRESEGSRRGVHYVAANDGRIPNEGEYDLKFSTVEGQDQCLTFQIAEVNKALCAVSNLVDNGYRIVFDKNMKSDQDTSHMIHKETGVTTRFRRTRNVWVLDAFIDCENNNKDESFHRRG